MATLSDQDEEQELSALIALRDAFHWQPEDRWPSRAHTLTDYCTMISGITCLPSSQGGHGVSVTMIDFTSRYLQGTIPTEIGYLTNLVRLKLGNNRFSGTLPATLSQLTLLEHLEVYRNNLTGTLPVLSPLTKLKRLLAQSNQLEGTLSPSLCDLTSLLALNLFKNKLEGTIPVCFENLEQLQTFQIEDNRLTGTVPWEVCDRMGLECAAVACPLATYGPIRGRQSTLMECLPCPTSMYLASTVCPESTAPTAVVFAEGPSTMLPSAPSVSPLPIMPTRAPTTKPSTVLLRPTSPQPSPYYTADESDLSDLTLIPTPDLTEGSLVSTTMVPFPRNTASMAHSTDWTLWTAAFLVSAVALLTVVVTRRRRLKLRDDQWRIQRDDDDKDAPPISSLILVPTMSRDPHSPYGSSSSIPASGALEDEYSLEEKHQSQVPPADRNNTSSHQRSMDNNSRHHRRRQSIYKNNKKDGQDNNNNNNNNASSHSRNKKQQDDNESLESDSGWDDTESSIDDDDNDADDDASKEDKKLYSSIYRWGSFFVNPIGVPV